MNEYMFQLMDECYSAEIEDTLPESLGLLEAFRRVKVFDKSFLNGVSVLFIQHHLSPLIGRLTCMAKDGMIPENTWFIDIPYSTNEEVKNKISETFTSHNYPEPLSNPIGKYTDFQLKRTKTVIREIIQSNPEKLLVIDDGAYFIRALYDLYAHDNELVKRLYNRTYLVEQTTRGHRYLQQEKYNGIRHILNIPAVSIARCRTKMDIESPFIGIACRRTIENSEQIIAKFKNTHESLPSPLTAGIIGYGAIGKAVFESVRPMQVPCRIQVIEPDLSKWAEIKGQQGIPMSELSDSGYDILFGCTGYASFMWTDRAKVNQNGLLISVSSGAVEFSRNNYIDFAELYSDDPITIRAINPEKGIHSDLLFEDGNKRFYFVNGGFPVNFTGLKECLPLKFIQPTHALLYAAAYQVLNEPRNDLQPLKDEYDNWVYYNAFNY